MVTRRPERRIIPHVETFSIRVSDDTVMDDDNPVTLERLVDF